MMEQYETCWTEIQSEYLYFKRYKKILQLNLLCFQNVCYVCAGAL